MLHIFALYIPLQHLHYLAYKLELIKGEYLVGKNTTNIRTDGIFYDLKLHVSAFIGHLQVSTVLYMLYNSAGLLI